MQPVDVTDTAEPGVVSIVAKVSNQGHWFALTGSDRSNSGASSLSEQAAGFGK